MSWILDLIHRRRIDRELTEEIESHLDEKTAEFMTSGLSKTEARQRARREFGNPTVCKEKMREVWGWASLERLGQDLRYGFRMLARNPGFTAVAVITLALGIGANTTIFSVVNALVLRPLRLEHPEQIVLIDEVNLKENNRRDPTEVTYLEWKERGKTLDGIARATWWGDPSTLSGMGRAERVNVTYCTPNLFSTLGVNAFRGRIFLPDDAPDGESSGIVISENLWQRSFQADPSIVGQVVAIDGGKKTIIGVLPPGFSLLPWDTQVDAWIAFNPGRNPRSRWLKAIGRLKAGATIERLRRSCTRSGPA